MQIHRAPWFRLFGRRLSVSQPRGPQYIPRRWSSVSQRPGLDHVHFPGAVNSKFSNEMKFERPSMKSAIPTFRVMDADGTLLDKKRAPPDVSDEQVIDLYENMLTVSIMDIIMFEAQRQGRLSFYMVSAGEEGIAVGSAAALSPEDVIFAQYRETGVYQQRGFKLKEFMSQLFANKDDLGKGRNMPVHYGSSKLNIVRRTFITTTPTSFPKKGAEDRNSIDTSSTEYSKTGTDDAVAENEDAAFNPDKTSPEEAENTAGKGNQHNPLDGSGANQEASKTKSSE